MRGKKGKCRDRCLLNKRRFCDSSFLQFFPKPNSLYSPLSKQTIETSVESSSHQGKYWIFDKIWVFLGGFCMWLWSLVFRVWGRKFQRGQRLIGVERRIIGKSLICCNKENVGNVCMSNMECFAYRFEWKSY